MAFLVLFSAFLFLQAATACNVDVGLLESVWGTIDEAGLTSYSKLLKDSILGDVNSSPQGRLYALGATFACVSEASWVRPGSGCAYKDIIEANLNHGDLNSAIDGFAVVLAQAAENFRRLGQCCIMPSPWPHMDNCCGDYGRIYSFESSWDASSGFNNKAVRCAARDLYLALTARPNNIGAAATASATRPAIAIYSCIQDELIHFFEEVTSDNCSAERQKRLRTLAGHLKSSIFAAAQEAKKSCA